MCIRDRDVQAAINAASGVLPKGIPNPPTYYKVNPADKMNEAFRMLETA